MPVVERERYVQVARGRQGLPQWHGRGDRGGERARQRAVPDPCPDALFGAAVLADVLVRRVYTRR